MVNHARHCNLTLHFLTFQSRGFFCTFIYFLLWFVFLNYVPNHSLWMLVFSINTSMYVCCFVRKLIFECSAATCCYYELCLTQPRNIKPVRIPDTQSMWCVRSLQWTFLSCNESGWRFPEMCKVLKFNVCFTFPKKSKMTVHSFPCARCFLPKFQRCTMKSFCNTQQEVSLDPHQQTNSSRCIL